MSKSPFLSAVTDLGSKFIIANPEQLGPPREKRMQISLPKADDFHSHLRQDALMKAVVPCIAQGGCGIAYVMVIFLIIN